ncbi:uncharacterized protein (DUF58 family) [Arthrobacter pigmenti]|uniref:Uncharacterized protein (DUF58 family) n=1 Tax=Arthrobacter pigmenti TaxID=271432 RepID=A0A846RNC3_9MICC|nr:DUF58 domain-containing protein [Arthrobacter pigmenti]NJC21824.1 uncharacterized protein (DUF58 family) [Arthrobacter pigmenti]
MVTSSDTAEKRSSRRRRAADPARPPKDSSSSRRGGKAAPRRAPSSSRLHPRSLSREAWQLAEAVVAPTARRAVATLSRYCGPALGVVSPLGWTMMATVVSLWLFGSIFEWREALIAALLGTILFVLAVGFIIGRSAYAVELDLTRTRVAVGDRAVGSVSVSNSSNKPLLPASLELPVGAATAIFHLPRLKPGQLHEDLFTIPTQRRAVIVVGPVRSVRADPLSLLRRQVFWTEPTDLYVHPRTTPLVGSAAGFIKDLEGLPTKELSSADVSFHALRDYVPGDDRRHIHWKTTARTGQLMVRQFEETRRSHLAVALSTNTQEYSSDLEFELGVSVAGSIGLQAIREQRNLSVLTQDGPLRSETGRNLLDDMTRIEGRNRRATAVDLARTTADTVPNASVVFFVVGPQVTPSQLRSAAASVPPGIRCIAIRCVADQEQGRATIGDLTVLTLNNLTDLAMILRKAAA